MRRPDAFFIQSMWVDLGPGAGAPAAESDPDFVVGHTRILHAWSLGPCLIAHRNMALAMSEIAHGENALLGSSGEEIAEHVAAVLEDPELRRRIGAAGRRTFERDFLPPTVMGRVMSRIEGDLRA